MSGAESITNILLAGVGGQGILLASEVLSETALQAGFEVKKSEVHGMSQRGGAVNTHVRFGPRIYSPLIPAGKAHFLVALEKLEALRWAHYLIPGGTLIVNDFRLDPISVSSGKLDYPEDAIGRLRRGDGSRLVVVDGPARAVKAGDLRAMNTVLLGALSTFLAFPEENWLAALKRHVKERYLGTNLQAFELGRQAALGA